MNYKLKMAIEGDLLDKIKCTHANFVSKKSNRLGHAAKSASMQKFAKQLHEKSFTYVTTLDAIGRWSKEPLAFENKLDGLEKSVSVGTVWADEVFDCMWVNMTAELSKHKVDTNKIAFLIDMGGEGLVVDSNGSAKQAITCYASDYDYQLGRPEKKIVLSEGLIHGDKVDFWIDLAGNDLFGYFHDQAKVCQMDVVIQNTEIRGLAYDVDVLISAYNYADNQTAKSIMQGLMKVRTMSKNGIDESSAKLMRSEIASLFKNANDDNKFTYSMIGHAHLDLAWLWPIRESYRKGIRTFSNQLMNLDKFPTYKFGASQAQLYDWVKRDNPEVYGRMSEYIKQGRWEVQGATWVEMDSNLIGGESLVRQFYYGKKYFQNEFGEDMKILWLPDSFGYSPCLPQVMKLANVPYFLTQKMSWNAVTKFPYHTFNWEGLDGSTVFAHMLPESTYNSPCRADKMVFGVKNYQEADKCRKAMMLAGIGDGGAGPGFEHLERATRLEDIKPLPSVKIEKAVNFFDDLEKDKDMFSTYKGELYLEKHQGTYTSRVLNKWYNRKCEFSLRNYELLISMLGYDEEKMPINNARLEEIWKEILLYQFHDILPGSSINRVYDECVPRYEILLKEIDKAVQALTAKTCDGNGFLNTNSYDYQHVFKSNGAWLSLYAKALTSVDAKNAVIINDFYAVAGKDFIENNSVKIIFRNGNIVSYFDKKLNKEFVSKNACMSEFIMYADKGDCWDIKSNYKKNKKSLNCTSFTSHSDGPTAVATMTFMIDNTVVKQCITITDDSSMATAKVSVKFAGQEQMLRLSFDTSMKSEVCSFNTQFGHFKRSTTELTKTEQAQFEVSGQKFIDMSDELSGISIINDSKYGFACKGSKMDMCIIRNPKGGPGKNIDQGNSEFKYAIFTHEGKLGMDTYKYAYLLNNPIIEVEGEEDLIQHNIDIDNKNIVLEAVKKADCGGSIVRLYNSSDTKQKLNVKMSGMTDVSVVDIMEDKISDVDGCISFNPFELMCIRFN